MTIKMMKRTSQITVPVETLMCRSSKIVKLTLISTRMQMIMISSSKIKMMKIKTSVSGNRRINNIPNSKEQVIRHKWCSKARQSYIKYKTPINPPAIRESNHKIIQFWIISKMPQWRLLRKTFKLKLMTVQQIQIHNNNKCKIEIVIMINKTLKITM